VDNQDVLTIDLINKILYVQTDSGKITSGWEKAIRAAASFNGTQLHEMQLTQDNVPVIVDKCIDFLYAHGMASPIHNEYIYI
jgi:Arf-GAP/Rho-GAP domain/ANK repeat/PH domain-containing protein 1